jgi:hypothetical protein
VVAHLRNALIDLGHDVTLFSTAEARTRARQIPVRDLAIRLDNEPLKSDREAWTRRRCSSCSRVLVPLRNSLGGTVVYHLL